MIKQIFGWLLLASGVVIIFLGIWSSYDIFNAKKPVPEIFKPQQIEKISPTAKKDSSAIEKQTEEAVQGILQEQLTKMLPPDMLPKILNLTRWSIIMTNLQFAGGKISMIGIQLLRNSKNNT